MVHLLSVRSRVSNVVGIRAAFRRSWYLVIALGLVFGCAALGMSLVQQPMYSATSALYVTAGSDDNTSAAYQGSLASQLRVSSYAQLAKSDAVIGNALSKSGLNLSTPDARKALSASSSEDSMLLDVSAVTSSPSLSQELVAATAESLSAYVERLETPTGGGQPLARLTVVSPAQANTRPVSPHILRNVSVGCLIGLLLGSVYLLLRARFSTLIRTDTDVSEAVPVAVLGSVASETHRDADMLPSRFGSSSLEAYRRAKAALTFVNVDSPPRLILVTSSTAEEGKTSSVLGLAAVFVEAGNSVVIVDADLRRPKVADRCGVSNDVGLSSVLGGHTSLEVALQEAPHFQGLSVLSAGPCPPSPAALLESERTKDTLEILKAQFDYVLVDSAPILPVVDSLPVSTMVDGVILVARCNLTRVGELAETEKILDSVGAKVVGVIVTDCPASSGYGAYSYEYSRDDLSN